MITNPVALVQLPFPSQTDLQEDLSTYYAAYFKRYAKVLPEYKVEEGDLWEAPIWVSHLDGAIGREDTTFVDLSRIAFSTDACINYIVQKVDTTYRLFFSPLAQNFQLAAEVSARLRLLGYKTVVGGNMALLANTNQFDVIADGTLNKELYKNIEHALKSNERIILQNKPQLGKNVTPIEYKPRYRLLSAFKKRVSLLRLSASHGCLYGCTFCGDAWSRQLHIVQQQLLIEEAAELNKLFPETKIIYIGDKTFGQSQEAISNLRHAIDPRWKWKLIVQTHASVVNEELIEKMLGLDVVACEMGFETADTPILRNLKKGVNIDQIQKAVSAINKAGIRVILNVLGGLPNATLESAQATREFMSEMRNEIYLYNLYNFVPYPKAPLFSVLKDRITDWNFANWREDKPVVFVPFHRTSQELWDDFLSIVNHARGLIGDD